MCAYVLQFRKSKLPVRLLRHPYVSREERLWTSGCYVKRSQGIQDELGHHVKTKLVTHVAQLVVTKVTAVWWVLGRDPMQETRVSKRILPNPGF